MTKRTPEIRRIDKQKLLDAIEERELVTHDELMTWAMYTASKILPSEQQRRDRSELLGFLLNGLELNGMIRWTEKGWVTVLQITNSQLCDIENRAWVEKDQEALEKVAQARVKPDGRHVRRELAEAREARMLEREREWAKQKKEEQAAQEAEMKRFRRKVLGRE